MWLYSIKTIWFFKKAAELNIQRFVYFYSFFILFIKKITEEESDLGMDQYL